MTRGDICIGAARGDYTGKPRPVVVVQDDRFDATNSVTVCLLTTHELEVPLVRIPIEATQLTGIRSRSYLMVDKLMTIPRSQITETVGRLSAADIVRLDRAILVFLGLAD